MWQTFRRGVPPTPDSKDPHGPALMFEPTAWEFPAT
ncbi:DUF397 domain-containing protein [Streptomyces rapamycinicus NRRL 5491]|nr:DUF397 domain-containing protein [Streptomyces rapamycinicus]UTO68159.1 DUF397 domain-containing protein [Streptomyces rapamycinicus]UTP37357.1 DUF397 domain-containing protein [Streptomyces rapamycinicus NRRL 5491]